MPILGIPCTDEQHLNVGRLSHSGLGLILEIDSIKSTDVTNALLSLGREHFHLKVNNIKKMFKLAGGPRRYYNADIWLLVFGALMLLCLFIKKCCTVCLQKCYKAFSKDKVE